ncbi:Serpentine Receptor, class H [Caenorhabditis elegans]|uniref:Serpentine Receptor, class H n=1 Tax=Caenorhabditis elegans TaxID=6239 RepID=O45740_CAEEL|nr:Serpentine Receptor, class H [Caenorhabditis elegans]CAB07281.3 Serpentine Receptor, class H [Caenorhabditis elegans]|eukprot:NP_507200.3 Uncharacterized protein CELE_T03E6.8 [Caenorhabditis elegans]
MSNFSICSLDHLNSSVLFLVFRLVPLLSIPSYILAWVFITRNKSKVVQAVKKLYLKQMLINFMSVILLCTVICPLLIPPIPGYFMTGLLATLRLNVALPLVIMTHVVLLVSLVIMQLFKHQLVTLSDLRYTKKFELSVKIIRWLFYFCYLMMAVVAISILPALSIEFDVDGFRREAFEFFNNSVCFCPQMFIADPRQWEIYIPYFCSIFFGGICCFTGVSSVLTCLKIVYDSRKIVSRETLTLQRNFTFILMYQACVCVALIIVPLAIVSTLFYADISILDNGLHFLLLISSQGAVNNLMHIVSALWRKFRKKLRLQSNQSWKSTAMWSTTATNVVT